jgi:spore coat protein U-like protein
MTKIYGSNSVYPVQNSSIGAGVYVTPSNNLTIPSAGDIRFNSNTVGSKFEVYTGVQWMPLGENVYTLDLSPDVQQVINWARKKMAEEAKLEKMMSQHPGLQKAWEQLEIMKRLCQETESQ